MITLSWVLPLFIILPVLSTVLNILQTLNGTLCFSMDVASVIDFSDSRFVSVTEQDKGYRILNKKNTSLEQICSATHPDLPYGCVMHLGDMVCDLGTVLKNDLYYKSRLDCRCVSVDYKEYGEEYTAFSIQVKEGEFLLSSFETTFSRNPKSYNCWYETEVLTCKLNSLFYYRFTICCALTIIALYLVKIINLFVPYERLGKLSFLTLWLSDKGVIRYCNWYSNKPFLIVKGCKVVTLSKINPKNDISLELSPVVMNDSNGYIVLEYSLGKAFLKIDTLNIQESHEVEMDSTEYVNLKYCIEKVLNKVPIVNNLSDKHFLSPNEVIKMIKEGCSPKEVAVTENDCQVLFGSFNNMNVKTLISDLKKTFLSHLKDDSLEFLIKHNFTFFNEFRSKELILALSGKYINPEGVKNTEWKIYLSDVNKHFLKNALKIKTLGKSKSFLKCEEKKYMDDLKFVQSAVTVIFGGDEGKKKNETKACEEAVEKDEVKEIYRNKDFVEESGESSLNESGREWSKSIKYLGCNSEIMVCKGGVIFHKDCMVKFKPKFSKKYEFKECISAYKELNNYFSSLQSNNKGIIQLKCEDLMKVIIGSESHLKHEHEIFLDQKTFLEEYQDGRISHPKNMEVYPCLSLTKPNNSVMETCCGKGNVILNTDLKIIPWAMAISFASAYAKDLEEFKAVRDNNENALLRVTNGKFKAKKALGLINTREIKLRNNVLNEMEGIVGIDLEGCQRISNMEVLDIISKLRSKKSTEFYEPMIKIIYQPESGSKEEIRSLNEFVYDKINELDVYNESLQQKVQRIKTKFRIRNKTFRSTCNNQIEEKARKTSLKILRFGKKEIMSDKLAESIKLFLSGKTGQISQNKILLENSGCKFKFKDLGLTRGLRKSILLKFKGQYANYLGNYPKCTEMLKECCNYTKVLKKFIDYYGAGGKSSYFLNSIKEIIINNRKNEQKGLKEYLNDKYIDYMKEMLSIKDENNKFVTAIKGKFK